MNSFPRLMYVLGPVLGDDHWSWGPPPSPGLRPLYWLVAASVLGEPCKAAPPPNPPVRGSLTTRKRGPSPAPLGCGVWQLIFFRRTCVCNRHFHVGIPLRAVLNAPAVQTGWLIKGILFVKQSPSAFLLPSFSNLHALGVSMNLETAQIEIANRNYTERIHISFERPQYIAKQFTCWHDIWKKIENWRISHKTPM